jgi:hypothetical protein
LFWVHLTMVGNQTLSHQVVLSTPRHGRESNFISSGCFEYTSPWSGIKLYLIRLFWVHLAMVGNQTLSHQVVLSTPRHGRESNFISSGCFEYTSPWSGIKLSTVVTILTDYFSRCESMKMTSTMVTWCKLKKKMIIVFL